MEADFWRFYQIDLINSMISDGISWRRFLIFVRGLPDDSAFYRFLRNKENRNFVESDIESIENEIDRLK